MITMAIRTAITRNDTTTPAAMPATADATEIRAMITQYNFTWLRCTIVTFFLCCVHSSASAERSSTLTADCCYLKSVAGIIRGESTCSEHSVTSP